MTVKRILHGMLQLDAKLRPRKLLQNYTKLSRTRYHTSLDVGIRSPPRNLDVEYLLRGIRLARQECDLIVQTGLIVKIR